MPRLRLLAVAAAALLAFPAGALAGSKGASVGIFYYPWFGDAARDGTYGHWADEGHVPPEDIAASYYPARGVYSSSDVGVLRAQMREIARAGVGEAIVSWWGWGSPEDARLPDVLAAARASRVSVAAHIEPYRWRTAETVEADVAHLRELGISTFYVYRPFEITVEAWAGLTAKLDDVRLFAETTLPGLAASAGFDGIYTYDVLSLDGGTFRRLCNQARVAGLVCAPSVGPGYDARRSLGDPRFKSRRRGATYDAMWTAALGSGADAVTITSYNEWAEGTQIEPARSRSARGYAGYAGAWGTKGRAAETAYLDRTSYWTHRFRRLRR